MLGSNTADVSMLYSPTPTKRRSGKSSRRRSKGKPKVVTSELPDQVVDGFSTPKSDQMSLSSKEVGMSVATASTTAMGDSDSECDGQSFFSDTFSAISELPEPVETVSPHISDAEKSPKKKKKKKKKKEKSQRNLMSPKSPKSQRSLKSPKSPESPESPDSPKKSKKKKKKEKTPKSEKSKKKSVKKKKDKSEKSTKKSSKSKDKTEEAFEVNDSEDESFLGESFSGTHRVEPRLLPQEEEEEEENFPGPPLWGETDEEDSCGEWVEDKSWNGWENDDDSEYVEETVCDQSCDGFSYYTIHSNEDPEMDGLGFLDDDDIEEDTDRDESGKASAKISSSGKKKVTFNECDTVHDTLHIADFTKKEIKQSWYQQKDYEETIEGVKEVANNAETPRDTQTRFRRQRSMLSKTAETRGLEAWTPSGVQRFRYIKEAAFRAVWDEQQKHYTAGSYDDDESDISTVIENQEKLREAYERMSQKSLKEAQLRAKKDEEIAAKLLPRKKRMGRRGSFQGALGSSSRRLLDGADHGLSDNPNAPASCLRIKQEDLLGEDSEEEDDTQWFGDSPRGLVRQKSDRSLTSFLQSNKGSNKHKSDRSVFSLPAGSSKKKKKAPERGLFRQMSDRGMCNDEEPQQQEMPQRGLLRQISDRSLFKKKSGRSLFNSKDSKKSSDFDAIAEEPKRRIQRRSSDLGSSTKSKEERRGLSRSSSLRI